MVLFGSFGGWLARLIFNLVLQVLVGSWFPSTFNPADRAVPLKFLGKARQRQEGRREGGDPPTHTIEQRGGV